MDAKIEQLENLTLGKIAEMTEQSKELLNNMKHFKIGVKINKFHREGGVRIIEDVEFLSLSLIREKDLINENCKVEKISAQDLIDSTDTKIKRPRF